jgi:protein SCO1/2
MRRALGLSVLALLLLSGCAGADLRGPVLDPPRPAPDFALTDQYGRTFRLSDQRGRVVLVFFAFTHCPDFCPMTLAKWRRVYEELGPYARRVRFVVVTVDPQRDTRERLREYLAQFHPDFIGLTGSEAELKPVYRAYGIVHERVQVPGSALGYMIAHTVTVSVVDPDGNWRILFRPETPVEDYVHDIRLLLRSQNGGAR